METVSAVAVVLVEGISDQLALEALDARRGLKTTLLALLVFDSFRN